MLVLDTFFVVVVYLCFFFFCFVICFVLYGCVNLVKTKRFEGT